MRDALLLFPGYLQVGKLRHKLCVLNHYTILSLHYEMLKVHKAQVTLVSSLRVPSLEY